MPTTTWSFNSCGTETSFKFPFARSNKNSVGFMEIKGEHPIDENRAFYDKRISQEVSGDALGEEFKGYVFKIMGGCDKQVFPMKQGVLTPGRVRLLLVRGTPCFRGYGRRNGECRRKFVRGCIVSQDLSVLLMYAAILGASPADKMSLRLSLPCVPDLSSQENSSILGSMRLGKYTEISERRALEHGNAMEPIQEIGEGKKEYTDDDLDEIRKEWANYVANFIFRD